MGNPPGWGCSAWSCSSRATRCGSAKCHRDWNAPPSLPEARAQRTFVVLRFEPLGEKSTRITLHHTGWGDGGEWDKAYAYFDRAWGNVLGTLKKRFETGPLDWSEWLNQLRKWREDAAKKP